MATSSGILHNSTAFVGCSHRKVNINSLFTVLAGPGVFPLGLSSFFDLQLIANLGKKVVVFPTFFSLH